MVIETRPLGPLSREIVSTIPDGVEPLDQGQGLTHRADIGIGSKVTSPIILQVPCHEDTGEWLLYGNLDIGIPLVIPMLDIEPGLVRLYAVGLQEERLDLCADDDRLQSIDTAYELTGLRRVVLATGEVATHPGAQ